MKFRFFIACLTLVGTTLFAAESEDPYENVKVQKVEVTIEGRAPSQVGEHKSIAGSLQTKAGEPFQQDLFDKDLKELSEKYERVLPTVKFNDDKTELTVHITLTPKRVITKYTVTGTSFSKKKILREGELKKGKEYDQEEFYTSINQIRDFLIKKGYFQARVSYTIEPAPETNEATMVIKIHQGPRGRIQKIIFHGFDATEEKEVMNIIRSRTFSVLTSWVTGSGTIREEEIEQDKQAIVTYFHNKGYVDAKIKISITETEKKKLALVIDLERGPEYHINKISVEGNSLYGDEKLTEDLPIKSGDVYSMEKIREAQEKLKAAYTNDGYLDTNVDYKLSILPDKHEYNVVYRVEESDQYKVGLIIVSGNKSTNKNVIYNNIDIEPGEVFDSRKLNAAQDRLNSTGQFKNVHVYAVKGDELDPAGQEYRDVMIEVEEAQTGSMNLFAGLSSTDSVFGGLDLTENNFNIEGLKSVWTDGVSALRGGGQYLQVKGTAGQKESSVNLSWMNPYFNDTLWRFGIEGGYSINEIVSNKYQLHTIVGSTSLRYPVNTYFNYGFRFRVKDAIVGIKADATPPAKEQKQNSGIISGFATTMGYDSTDNTFKPHRGLRSNFEAEFAGLVRRDDEFDDFPFAKFGYLNSYYLPIWSKGTLKFRADLKFIYPFWDGKASDMPLNERFFLGGEGTVRGYAPGKIGAFFGGDPKEPTGGISSELFSVEYLQNIFKPVDAFIFFDSGSVSLNRFALETLKMSAGAGLRFDIGRQLPFVLGWGVPLNEPDEEKIQNFFFSMAGEF